MEPIKIMPCLDMKNGRVVKGVHFVDIKEAGDPVENAAFYQAEGADELAMLDIAATLENRKTRLEWVRKVSAVISIPLTVGGGISSIEDIEMVLAIDAKRNAAMTSGFELVVSGGTLPIAKDAVAWAKTCQELGAGVILPTSMDGDGTKAGYDIPFTRAISSAVTLPVVASGGAGKLEDFYEAVVKGGASVLLAASVFHFRMLKIRDVKDYLRGKGLAVA